MGNIGPGELLILAVGIGLVVVGVPVGPSSSRWCSPTRASHLPRSNVDPMSAFRDEHTALLERIARLEEDLAARGGVVDQAAIARELEELSKRVADATSRVDADRKAPARSEPPLLYLRRIVAPPEPSQPAAPTEPVVEPSKPKSKPGLLVVVMVSALLFVIGFVVWVTQKIPPVVTSPHVVPATLDPSALLADARAHAESGISNPELTRIRVVYATSDGLIHPHEASYSASAEFDFASPPPAAEPAPSSAPLGVAPPMVLQARSSAVVRLRRVRRSRLVPAGAVRRPVRPKPALHHCGRMEGCHRRGSARERGRHGHVSKAAVDPRPLALRDRGDEARVRHHPHRLHHRGDTLNSAV